MFTLPTFQGLSATYFVSLTLESAGQVKSRNFYWLSTREETIDWARQEEDPTGEYDISTWAPTKTFADYTALNTLPRIDLDATARITTQRRRQLNHGHRPQSDIDSWPLPCT